MLKTFQYRIYPSKAQEKRMDATLETCRWFYNSCLEERKTAWEEEQRTIGKFEQLKRVAVFKAESEFAKPVHSHILQGVVVDLDKAFAAFFRRLKAGETPGYPRFKGRFRFNSFAFKEYMNGFKIDGRRLKLSGIGRVPVRWHRPYEGEIKTARIVRKADGWYVSLACEIGDPVKLPVTGSTIGIDVGLAALITTSDGEQIAPPKHYRKMQAKFRRQQRKVSRRKKGGGMRRKAVKILAKQHQVVERQRKDCLNKIVFNLVQNHDRIAVEDLKITNMVKNRSLAKSILDAGWGYFKDHLRFKAACAGREVAMVNPAYTSKMCSNCGTIKEELSLKNRVYVCACGLRLDRDINAAINIRDKAFKIPAGRAGRDSSGAIALLSLEAAGF